MSTQSPSKTPYIAGLFLVLVVVAIATWQLVFKEKMDETIETERVEVNVPQPEVVQPEVIDEPPAQQAQLVAVNEPAALPEKQEEKAVAVAETIILPELNDSDSVVKESLSTLAPVSLLKLVVDDDLVRRAVVFTENLAEGKVAKKHHFLKQPQDKFTVLDGAKVVVDPTSFKRYDKYVELFTTIEDEQLISLINDFKPLIEEAYDEIGLSDVVFEERLKLAFEQLIDTPEVPMNTPLVSQSVTYQYAQAEYESLSDAQKQLLRMGPENSAKLKSKLKRLISKL